MKIIEKEDEQQKKLKITSSTSKPIHAISG